jgi:hypothetical protein
MKKYVFQSICGCITRHPNQNSGETQLKFYKAMARLTLLYRSETLVTAKRYESGIEAAEVRFLKAVRMLTSRQDTE